MDETSKQWVMFAISARREEKEWADGEHLWRIRWHVGRHQDLSESFSLTHEVSGVNLSIAQPHLEVVDASDECTVRF